MIVELRIEILLGTELSCSVHQRLSVFPTFLTFPTLIFLHRRLFSELFDVLFVSLCKLSCDTKGRFLSGKVARIHCERGYKF